MLLPYYKALALPYMGKMLRRGFSPRDILDNMIDFGWDVPYQWAYPQMSRLATRDRLEGVVMAAPKDEPLGDWAMQEVREPMRRKYKIMAGVGEYDPELEEWSGGYVSMYTDSNLGEQGWISEFEEQFGFEYLAEERGWTEFTLLGVEHRAGWDYT